MEVVTMDNMLSVIIYSLLIVFFSIFIAKRWLSGKHLPPGPIGLPILGCIPFRKSHGYFTVDHFARKYGEIVSFRFGMRLIVLLSSPGVIKEALHVQGNNFSGRSDSKFNDMFHKKRGLIFIDGPVWKIHRPFAIKVLKNFGMGRNISEEIVHKEVEYFMKRLDDNIGRPFNPSPLLAESIVNIISVLTMGYRLPEEDPEMFEILLFFINLSSDFGPTNTMIDFYPMMEHIYPLMTLLPKSKKFWRGLDILMDRIRAKVDVCRENFNFNMEANNYCEAFLLEQHRLREVANNEGTFTEAQLQQSILELFLAGTDTTANTITWAILYLTLNPEIQEKVHVEIVDRLGEARLPTMADKKELNYVIAVLDEVSRMSSLVPIMVHRNFEATKLSGYDIPENTLCWINTYSVHHDPKIWERPFEFYPEHFLTDDAIYQPRDELMPFLVGKRSCLGEALARTELFIIFVSLFQRYQFQIEHMSECNLKETLLGSDGLIKRPGKFKVTVNHYTG